MKSLKVDLFGDAATQQRIRAASDPAKKKTLGRTVSGFDQACNDVVMTFSVRSRCICSANTQVSDERW